MRSAAAPASAAAVTAPAEPEPAAMPVSDGGDLSPRVLNLTGLKKVKVQINFENI